MSGDPDQTPKPAGWQFNPDQDDKKSDDPDSQPPQTDGQAQAAPVAPAAPAPAGSPPETDQPDTPGDSDGASAAPVQSPEDTLTADVSPPAVVSPDVTDTPEASVSSDTSDASQPEPVHDDLLQWTATDGMHQQSAGWLAILGIGVVILAALVYLVTRDKVSTGSIVLAVLLFGVYSLRKTQTLQYQMDNDGIAIGQKLYPYAQFRSFSVVEPGDIVLMPLKRFMPLLTISYAPDMEERVIAMLADRLPMETYKRDAMDALIRKLRF